MKRYIQVYHLIYAINREISVHQHMGNIQHLSHQISSPEFAQYLPKTNENNETLSE